MVHVHTIEDAPAGSGAEDHGWRRLAEELQAPVVEVESTDIAAALMEIARNRASATW